MLMGDITAGAVGEGERLPSLTELAAQFEVSTGVVRECQRALQERGLVSVHHGRRAVVRPEEDWDVFDPDVLAALMGGRRAPAILAEYLESRRILEVEAAGLAAERAAPADVQRLSSAFEDMLRGSPARSGEPRPRSRSTRRPTSTSTGPSSAPRATAPWRAWPSRSIAR